MPTSKSENRASAGPLKPLTPGSTFCRCSVAQSCPTLWPHGLQHARLLCPSPSPGAHSNPCPLSRWRHPTILSSVVPFSSCPQSLPALGSFPMSQLFTSGGQSIGVSASAISPSDEYSGLISFRMDWLDLLAVQGTLKSLLQHHSSKASILWHWVFFMVQLPHPYMTTRKTIALTSRTSVGKVMFLLFNMLSRFVVASLPRSKHLLTSWLHHHLQWFWSPRKQSVAASLVSPSIYHEVMGLDVVVLVFRMLTLKPAFSLSSLPLPPLNLQPDLPRSATSLAAQMVKNLPAMRETGSWSLGQEDPLEKEMAAHSSTPAWRIPWTEDPGGQPTGLQRVRHGWATDIFTFNQK